MMILNGSGSTAGSRRGRSGSALIVVLWVVTLLGMIVGSFAFDAHIEARLTSYYRKRSRADYLARSGLEVAKVVVAKSTMVDANADGEAMAEEDRWYEDALRLKQGDSVTVTESLDVGTLELTIVSERARRNVNLLQDETEWEPVLEVADIPEDYWPELIESFLDWTDADDVSRVDGAETDDFYDELDPPYRARNGALFTVDELLLIKGFSEAIVFGGALDPEDEDSLVVSGMADLLTVFGDRRINANSASRRVLMTLPDPDGTADLVAGAIIEERSGATRPDSEENSFFESDADLFMRVPEAGIPARRGYITTSSSAFFRVTSVGIVGSIRRTISCIVQRTGSDFRVLRWSEEG